MTTIYTATPKKTLTEINEVFAYMDTEDYKALGDAYDRKFYEDKPFGDEARKLAKSYGLTVRDVMLYFLS